MQRANPMCGSCVNELGGRLHTRRPKIEAVIYLLAVLAYTTDADLRFTMLHEQ
jgi:hypothetical protein